MGESDDERFLLETINEGSSQYYQEEDHDDCSQYLNEDPPILQREQPE